MTDLLIAHTAELDLETLRAARALLYDVFDDMTEHDWEHSVGGVHAIVSDGSAVIGHAAVVQRRLIHGGRALRAGYVEGVGVRSDRRGEGHGATMMDALEGVIGRAYDLGALGATDEAATFYAARGWQPWTGALSALTPAGVQATPEEVGGIFVLRATASLDLDGDLICDWRDGDVW